MLRSSAGDRFDLNDVKGLRKSSGIEKGNCSILMTLWGMPRGLFLLLLFYKVLRIHVLSE